LKLACHIKNRGWGGHAVNCGQKANVGGFGG